MENGTGCADKERYIDIHDLFRLSTMPREKSHRIVPFLARWLVVAIFVTLNSPSQAQVVSTRDARDGPQAPVAIAESYPAETAPPSIGSNPIVDTSFALDTSSQDSSQQSVEIEERQTKNATKYVDVMDSERNTVPSSISNLQNIVVGYDRGFVVASAKDFRTDAARYPYSLHLNGYGQLRHTILDTHNDNPEINQFQLKRARLILSGNAFSTDLAYFVQLDGRSNSGDVMRLLDYYFTYDVGHGWLDLDENTIGLKTGLYKIPFSLARWSSGKEFQFTDRSVSSMYFDVNRSLALGLYGTFNALSTPLEWETALFNGLVTGGAETGNGGTLDNNMAYAIRISSNPVGEWGSDDLADLEFHESLATRVGAGAAYSMIDARGTTEYNALRTVDSGQTLASILPTFTEGYSVALFSLDASMKYRGLSLTYEYYFRNISNLRGTTLPNLFDHGMWLESGYFIVPQKWQCLARWSRVQGDSGTLGANAESSEEIAIGAVRYFREQHLKLTADVTYLNGAPIFSPILDISPGDIGWLYRVQMQFSF